MKSVRRYLSTIVAAATLVFMSCATADGRVGSNNISLHGKDVIITARDGSEALVTPDGDLVIRDRPLPVNSNQRELLKKYSAGILDIEKRGLRLGRHAVAMVGSMVGTLVDDLIAGHDEAIDKDMDAKAKPLKDAAQAICADIRVQKQLELQIVATLPAFKPYAVIDTGSTDDCHVDDNL